MEEKISLVFAPYAIRADIYTTQLPRGSTLCYAFLWIVIDNGDFPGAAFKCAVISGGTFVPLAVAWFYNVRLAPGMAAIRGKEQDGMDMAGNTDKSSVCHGEQLGKNAPVTDGIGRFPGFAAVVGVGAVQGRIHLMSTGADDTYNMPGLKFNAVRFAVSFCVYIGDGIGLHICDGGEKREGVAAVFGQNTPGAVQIKIIPAMGLKIRTKGGVLLRLTVHSGEDVSVGKLDEAVGDAAGVTVAGISPARQSPVYRFV